MEPCKALVEVPLLEEMRLFEEQAKSWRAASIKNLSATCLATVSLTQHRSTI